MTRRNVIIATIGLALSTGCYFVLWQTHWGRVIRGISTVAVCNRSSASVENVHVLLVDTKGREFDRRYEHLRPGQTVRVCVRASELRIRSIVCEQANRTLTYVAGGNVAPGEVFLVGVDEQGTMSGEYEP